MCLTVPRKVEEVKDGKARLQDGRWVLLSLLEEEIKPGDMVLAQANMAVQKVSKKGVKEMKNIVVDEMG